MNFLRKHWYDLGGLLAVVVCGYVFARFDRLTHYQLLTWASLVSLFLHQLEEYRFVGTFPGMVNAVMYRSDAPDRYPLNTNTAFVVNVVVGWSTYFLAAVLAEKAVWLGMATSIISVGNIVAHIIVFNAKGRTFYNAGMFTSVLLFLPGEWLFFSIIHPDHLATTTDYFIGVPLGIALNVLGILKPINWMADRNTRYVFERRQLLPRHRDALPDS